MNPTPISLAVATGYTVQVDGINASGWSHLLEQFADASIYQTWEYGAVCWGENQLSHLVMKQDKTVVAIAQVRIVQVPFLKRGVAYVRWGPLWRRTNAPYNLQHFRRMLHALVDEYVHSRKLLLRLLPNVYLEEEYGQAVSQICSDLRLIRSSKHRPYCTMRVNLMRSLPDLRAALDAKWRNKLNGAERNGLTVSEGSGDEFYSAFAAVYREMIGRKQFKTTVSIEKFSLIQQALPEHLKMRILLCQRDSQVLNALVITHLGETPIYLLGATSDEGMRSKGAYLLQWHAMKWLKDRGAIWYDLGGVDPKANPGVYEFKRGFSGQEAHYIGSIERSGSCISSTLERAGALFASMRSGDGKSK